jgi:hypothetical protein
MRRLELRDLQGQIKEMGGRLPDLRDDALFVLWFLEAYLTGPEMEDVAVQSLTGSSRDKDIDAVFIDEGPRAVYVVQGKYRKSLAQVQEKRQSLVSFSNLPTALAQEDEHFAKFCHDMDPIAATKLKEARERVRDRGYRLQLYYVTMGRCSSALRKEVARQARAARLDGQRARLEVFDGVRVMAVLSEYLDGVAPPVPSLDLPVQRDAVYHFDHDSGIESWVFTMSGEDVARLFKQAGIRIFARNIRGYLGDTKINQAMKQTLKGSPGFFWYYNNGVTIVCDAARREQELGQEVLSVSNPQIINGQQTTRALNDAVRRAGLASVLVRVISIPRETTQPRGHFDTVVSNIVQATNSQNRIGPSDLRANDRRQIILERELRKRGYKYIRKRQSKSEARTVPGPRRMISKEEMAKALGGCKYESLPLRAGRERLFDQYYEQIFASHTVTYCLCCYWLMRSINSLARGSSERLWSRHVVLFFAWKILGPEIRARQEQFIGACESPNRDPRVTQTLNRALTHVFEGAGRFYRANRGTGSDRLELSPFFKRQGVYERFERFWNSRRNKRRQPFIRAHASFRKSLAAMN